MSAFLSLGELLAFVPPRKSPGPEIVVYWFLSAVALVTPSTPAYRLLRAAIFAPIIIYGTLRWGFTSIQTDYADTWGGVILCAQHVLRVIEMLVFFPPEETSFRMIPLARDTDHLKVSQKDNGRDHSNGHVNGHSNGSIKAQTVHAKDDTTELVPEPVPQPWTWGKFTWALSLWASWRGIGWNYAIPLPKSSRREPFTRSSTRPAWFIHQITYYISIHILYDLVRSYMNCSAARTFFSTAGTAGGPTYGDLSHGQRAVYTFCVAFRVWWCMYLGRGPFSMVVMAIGGLLGLKGEFWEPWGWPPVFGGLTDLWEYPGLSYAWSTIWHSYFRRFLYILGWVGIGENVLNLPQSGPRPNAILTKPSSVASGSSRPAETKPEPLSQVSTPLASGRVTPSHPLPTESLSPKNRKDFRLSLILSNYIKSTLVFAICGLLHDTACTRMFLDSTQEPLSSVKWRDAFAVTPFFLVQPLALAIEAVVKNNWRRFKRAQFGSRPIPSWLRFAEKLVGFLSTWLFLGWSARWWIPGLLRAGLYRRDSGQTLTPSLFGGLIWGRWKH